MEVWIQSAKSEAEELNLSEEEAKRRFSFHDWAAERRAEAAREEAGQESCAPGMGFVRDDGRILHICPGESVCMVHFHKPTKILGLLRTSNRVHTAPEIPNDRARELIGHFYRRRDDVLEGIV
jgi:hypothetical protein